MKATGIVRRIDDLGRVVIPKEIRRTMRIREGDPLEIFTGGDGDVIFKKYSPMGELAQLAVVCCESLIKCTDKTVLICDRDHCIAAGGISKKEVLERRLTAPMEDILETRRPYFRNERNAEKIMALEGVNKVVTAACPILSSGDINGVVIFVSEQEHPATNETDNKLVVAAAGFLSKNIEE